MLEFPDRQANLDLLNDIPRRIERAVTPGVRRSDSDADVAERQRSHAMFGHDMTRVEARAGLFHYTGEFLH